MNEDIKKLVEKYPNDFDLGSKVREMYWTERDRLYRELLDLPAQQSTTEGTSVTRVETQLELREKYGDEPPLFINYDYNGETTKK